MLKVFNNLSSKLENFLPLDPDRVVMYTCGPTVYDYSHLGHARSCLVWDMVYRYLKYKKYNITWIRNITNIDDKIIKRANELNCSPEKLSRIFTYEFWQDMANLNISWPDYEPRATDYLPQMYEFIQNLIDKACAYHIDGDVYFRVAKHRHYGQLKKLSLDELSEGINRIDSNSRKEDQMDFALWKAFPNEAKTSFLSPWGLGRPGWHLECSTMISSILSELNYGPSLDIHAGGDDLLFPHHENECAQSESLTGFPLAKYWLHNGMVLINGAKMSKSESNFFRIRDLLSQYDANTLRYFAFSTHYKKAINFSDEALKAAQNGLAKLLNFIKDSDKNSNDLNVSLMEEFEAFMDDDFASPQALALLFENKDKDNASTIAFLLKTLGFDLNLSKVQNLSPIVNSLMDLILDLRMKARSNKDFATSDQIRKQLSEAGISIMDFRDQASKWIFD